MTHFSISYIILNYNGGRRLTDCVASVYRQAGNHDDIIVVDNNSTDDSLNTVRKQFPDIRTIELPVNIGFGAANNHGIRAARYEHIVLLNFDIVLDATFTQALADAEENCDDRTAGLIPLVLFADRKQVVNSTGVELCLDYFSYNRGINEILDTALIERSPGRPETFLGFYGAAVLLRKKNIIQAGYFDESYFLYQEETNLSLKIYRQNYRFRFVPDARAYHVHSVSLGEKSFKKIFYCERNRIFNLFIFGSVRDIIYSPVHTIIRLARQNKRKLLHHSPASQLSLRYKLGVMAVLLISMLSVFFYLDDLLYRRKKYL